MKVWRRLISAAFAFAAASVPAAADDLALAVKATYLYKLAPFVTWPVDSTRPDFHICVVGIDPFGQVLDRAVAGQAYDGRPFRILRLEAIDAQSPCDIAYVSSTASLTAVAGAPILTVTDEGAPPGMVAFVADKGRVRFRIDQDEVHASGLTLSSKLLSLALSVKGGGR